MPSARLVALLRNPADRAHSHWRFQTEIGNEMLSFEEALEAEDERLAGTHPGDKAHRRFSYRSRGLYALQLERWFDAYGPEPLMVIKAEAFYEKPDVVLRRAHEHIGLEPKSTRESPNAHTKNAAGGPPMRPEARRELEAFFSPHNEQLYDLLGRDLDW